MDNENVVTGEMVKDLYDRMSQCENELHNKEKEMASLTRIQFRFNGEMTSLKGEFEEASQVSQQKLDNKSQEIAMLTEKNDALERRVAQLEQQSKTLDEITKEVAEMKVKTNSETTANKVSASDVCGSSSKNISLKLHRGEENDIKFSHNNRRIEFTRFSTISVPDVIVRKGEKVWYEVKYLHVISPDDVDDASAGGISQIGWASKNLTIVRRHAVPDKGVGDVAESYAFDPLRIWKWECGNVHPSWGKKFKNKGPKVLGVALDMVKGEILYSVNGNWNPPMGRAFKVNMKTEFFAALSAVSVTLNVNFGEQPFSFGPPDGTFESLAKV